MSTPTIGVRSPDDSSSRAPQRHVPRAGEEVGGRKPRIEAGIISLCNRSGWGWAWYQHPDSWGVGITEESDVYTVEMESLFHTVYALPDNRDVTLHIDSPWLHDVKMNVRSLLMAESMGRSTGGHDMDMIRELNLLMLSRDGKESTVLHKSQDRHPLLMRAQSKLKIALRQFDRGEDYDPGPGWSEAPETPEGPAKRVLYPYQGPPIKRRKGRRNP